MKKATHSEEQGSRAHGHHINPAVVLASAPTKQTRVVAMTGPVTMFADALRCVFGQLDWLPIPDGQIHRFKVPGDKPGSHNGWYVLYLDGIASGAFGSWKAGG